MQKIARAVVEHWRANPGPLAVPDQRIASAAGATGAAR
jgi:O6-methylguanine-DNA--protein-cysteine methyltransferase